MVDEISPAELWEKIQDGEQVQIIDIRPANEFKQGHIPGAINIPLSRFAQEVDNHDWQETIVIACPIGESSRQAARLLESYGGISQDSNVVNLDGGYRDWEFDLEQEV